MTSAATPRAWREMVRGETREMSGVWWWYLLLGILWTLFGMFVLSYRVGSVTAVAAFVGVAFLFGGITLLGLAMLTPGGWRWLNIIVGILALIAGIITFAWPAITLYVVSIFVAWYLIVFGIIHFVNALAGPKLAWWWTNLLLGIAEFVLGVWAARSWERSLLTLVTLVGVWAIFHGVSQIIGAFTLRDAGKQVERAIG
jgi:uncharacterized membrane protein HdeD (DUF308 family)